MYSSCVMDLQYNFRWLHARAVATLPLPSPVPPWPYEPRFAARLPSWEADLAADDAGERARVEREVLVVHRVARAVVHVEDERVGAARVERRQRAGTVLELGAQLRAHRVDRARAFDALLRGALRLLLGRAHRRLGVRLPRRRRRLVPRALGLLVHRRLDPRLLVGRRLLRRRARRLAAASSRRASAARSRGRRRPRACGSRAG